MAKNIRRKAGRWALGAGRWALNYLAATLPPKDNHAFSI